MAERHPISASIDLFGTSLTSNWNGNVDSLLTGKAILATADGTTYDDVGLGGITGSGTTTLVSPIETPGVGTPPANGLVNFRVGYCKDTGGVTPSTATNNIAFTITGITSATLNACVGLVMVFGSAVNDDSPDGFAFRTLAGDAYSTTMVLSGGGSTTLIYSITGGGGTFTVGTLISSAGTIDRASDSAPCIAFTGQPLTEITGISTVTPPTFDLGTRKLRVKFLQAEDIANTPQFHYTTVGNVGYDGLSSAAVDALTFDITMTPGTGSGVAGQMSMEAGTVTTSVGNTNNLAISGVAVTEGSSGVDPPSTTPTVWAGIKPISSELLTLDDFDLNDRENLVVQGSGLCSGTVYHIDGLSDWTDSALVKFGIPQTIRDGTINGFKYTYKGVKVSLNVAETVYLEVSVLDGSFKRCGVPELLRPEASGANVTVSQDLVSTLITSANRTGGPDGITLFSGTLDVFSGGNDILHSDPGTAQYWDPTQIPALSGGSSTKHLGTHVNRGQDFGGLTFRFRAGASAGAVRYTGYVDSLELSVYYTPGVADKDISYSLTPSGVAAGVFSDYALNDQTVNASWASISNMLSGDTTIATCGIGDCSTMLTPPPGTTATDTNGASVPLVFSFAAGQISQTSAKELRFQWKGRVEAYADTDHVPDYARLYDLQLCKADGTVLVDTSNSLYGVSNFKIGSYGWFGASAALNRNGERWRTAVLDVSGLSSGQLSDMNTNGFKIIVRFRFTNLQAADGYYCAVAISRTQFVITRNFDHSLSKADKELCLLS